jgi:uncharacterized protein (DUF305 family)
MSVSVESEPESPETDDAIPPARRRSGAGWLAAGVALGLLLGLVAGLLIVPTFTRPGEDSVEAGFARDMSTHHAQAVEMGMLAHQKASDSDVRTLGGDIALTQQAQIGMMQTWLREWKLGPTGSRPRMAWMPDGTAGVQNGLMPGMATDADRQQLRSATGRAFDVLFLQLMIKHHLGGIHMAEEVLKLTDNAEVRRLAQSMVDNQRNEVAAFQLLLKKLGATA